MGTMTNIWLRRVEHVERAAREAIRLAEEMTLPLWHAWSRIHLGWAMSQNDATLGLTEIEAGLREAAEIGAGRYEPFHLGIAAEAYARAGRKDEAERRISKAFTALSRRDHDAFAAELYRTRAAILTRLDEREHEAAAGDLLRALDLARRQKALSLELRAGRDLARLLAEQGERERAIDILAPVYRRFTEGFGAPDLVEASALLSDLGA
jgi:tetratricopeptide (TPR) repeat protein